MLIYLYYSKNYVIICIEIVTYPFNPARFHGSLSVGCWFAGSFLVLFYLAFFNDNGKALKCNGEEFECEEKALKITQSC